jgi:hypothetical protein
MATNTGLLEAGLAEALQNASDAELAEWRELPQEAADAAPRTQRAVVDKITEIYRAHQNVVDAAVQGLTASLQSTQGAADFKALETLYREGQAPDLSRAITDRILESEEMRAFHSQLKSADLVSAGVGIAGDIFYWGGIGGGYENLYDQYFDYRAWGEFEVQYKAGITLGPSVSLWWNQPVKSLIFGLVVELSSAPYGIRVMVMGQYGFVQKKFDFGGILIQVGGASTKPQIAGGIFLGVSWPYLTRRLSVDVEDTTTKTSTIQVNTAATLAVTITANVELSFDTDSRMKVSMPYYFTSDDVAAMTITDLTGNWSATTDGTNFLLEPSSSITMSAGDQITFRIENAQSAGTANAGEVQKGYVIVTTQPTNKKLPSEAQAELSLAWEQFAASVTWTAIAGTASGHLTLTGDCANAQNGCSGGPVTAYSQNNLNITTLATAVDSDGTTWNLGYQFNYVKNEDGTYITRLRAAIYDSTASSSVARYPGDWIEYGYTGEPSIAKYKNTSGQTQISVTVAWDS